MDPECIGIIERTQDPTEILDYSVDFERALTRFRQPATTYTANTRVRSRIAPGLQFNCTTAGQTGAKEPRWPTVVGGTVQDGGVVWTAEAVSTASLTSTLSSAAWSSNTGITIASASISGQQASALVSTGVVGQLYNIICTGTMADGRKMTGVIALSIVRKVQGE